MNEIFPYEQVEAPLFCPSCQSIMRHDVRSQLRMQDHQPSLLHSPLHFRCQTCQHGQIYFAREVASFSPPLGMWHKIAGHHRLIVKDEVYVPGYDFPGQIKSRYRSGSQEIFVITQPDGTEKRWTTDYAPDFELPLERVRLLPLAAADTLVGDAIWHAGREQPGKAVGMVFGNPSKLIIQLHNGTLLTLPLPDSRTVADNTDLHKLAISLLKAFFPPEAGNLQVDAASGILHVRGTCDSLQRWIDLRRKMKTLPQCRGLVELVAIQPSEFIADEEIEKACRNSMLAPHYGIFNLKVHCSKGQCRVDAFCRNDSQRIEAIEAIESVPGLCSLEAEILTRPDDNHSDRERSLQVAQALRNNNTLKHCVIRVHCYEGLTQLEGIVSSQMQRNIAGMAAMWAGRKFRIDNQLRVEPNYPYTSPNIRVV